MDEKTKDFLKNYAGYLAVALISFIYIATSVITMGKTGKSIGTIIAEGSASFLVGFVITRLFDVQGIMDGKRDKSVLETVEEHANVVESIEPHLDKLDAWCEKENAKARKTARTRMLAASGMKYSDYFEEDEPLPFTFATGLEKTARRDERRRHRTFLRALNVKLTQLSSGLLMSESREQRDVNYLGPTEDEYERRGAIKDVISKLMLAIVFGYYGVDLVANFSYALLIWRALQVVSYVCMGILKMNKSRRFILEEYRGRIIKKIGYLKKFEIDIKNGGIENGKKSSY